eukprot:6199901-Ditylum_brightwellii.AAC.1
MSAWCQSNIFVMGKACTNASPMSKWMMVSKLFKKYKKKFPEAILNYFILSLDSNGKPFCILQM